MINVATLFVDSVATYPHNVMVHCGGQRFTYSRLNDASCRFAAKLHETGVGGWRSCCYCFAQCCVCPGDL